jgi:hypothetical protein
MTLTAALSSAAVLFCDYRDNVRAERLDKE